MRSISLLSGLTAAFLLIPSAVEASGSMRFYVPRDQRVDRPSTRAIERAANIRWDEQAAVRRGFVRKLETLEGKRDEIAPEPSAALSPELTSNPQDFTPYHWAIRRRHVRHQYWDSYYERGTPAHVGQGLLGQPGLVEQEGYRNDIEVDAGGR
ncbi:MAG: hypothetical protein KC680_00405 [Candidatus Peregrinibacteria bacterium]|nr:hypothetical protein [Candidatus Peregrinibacteria bacterium]MCB9807708.1 hypothetical protein [Candidatus Peribacteria bacterium]